MVSRQWRTEQKMFKPTQSEELGVLVYPEPWFCLALTVLTMKLTGWDCEWSGVC